MDEKNVDVDDVFSSNGESQDIEEKPRQRRVNSVKSSYDHQISYEEQSSTDSIELDGLDILFNKKRLVLMESNYQLKELQTTLWDKSTSREHFVFHADRLIRLVIEEGLNQLPFVEHSVMTHSGTAYKGCSFYKGICGVSIVRSGEAMEKGLRECCRSIRIGKILMTKEEETNQRQIIYNRFPPDMHERKVLLMYPLLCKCSGRITVGYHLGVTGGNVIVGVEALLDYGVEEKNIYILSLFATPKSVKLLFKKHPDVLLLTTELRSEVPVHFGEKYYGTDF